jgi:hypothetical protein
LPRWISERDFAQPQQVGQVNDQDQRGTSKKPMNVLTGGRITLHSAWQDDEARLLPVAEAERIVGLWVALRQRLQATTHQFREIGSRKQDDGDLRVQQLIDVNPRRHEQWKHHAGRVYQRHQWHAGDQLDIEHA